MRALSLFRHPASVFLALALVVLVTWAPPAAAKKAKADCDGEMSSLHLGNVSLLNSGVVDASATLTYRCNGQPGDKILVCVGMGPNPVAPGMGSFVPRYLELDNGGGQTSNMAFNLYSDPARTDIWGDFGSASYQPKAFVMEFGAGQYYLAQTQTVYGRIKTQGQTGLPSGLYNTNATGGGWPVSVGGKVFTGSNLPSCMNLGNLSTSKSYIAATVKSECRIDTVSDLDFGTVFQTLDRNIDSTGTIAITCTSPSWSGGSYRVMLGDGLHASGQQRRMQGPGGAFLDYGLYRDAARTERWGDTEQTGVSQAGNGQPQQLRVYGRVPPQAVSAAGNYSDTVVVTVSY